MNPRTTSARRIVLLHRALILCCIPSIMAASPPRLMIERVSVASGYMPEITPGAEGTVMISGDYSATGLNQSEPRPPHIAVLDGTGKVVQRLQPPSLSASSDPTQQILGPFVRWRVRAALPEGRFLVDDDAHFLPRLILARDGTPLRQELGDPWSGGEPLPTGPVAVARDGSVLLGRSPNDVGRAALVRAQFGRTPLAYDPAFELNVYHAWPQPGLRCARMVVTDDDRIWAWLGFPGDPRARLFRFLPDGRPDPAFQPAASIESLENSDEPFAPGSRSTWLGASPGGQVILVVEEPFSGGQRLRRLLPDGTTDPIFEVPFNQYNQRPQGMLPDGSVLIERRDPSDGPDQQYGLIRVSPDGHRDPTWGAQLPNGWIFNVFGRISVVPMANGSVWVALHTGRGPISELYRLNPDGSLDTSFDGSVISPTPVRRLRLTASGLLPGVIYSLRRSQGLPTGFSEWATFTVQPFQTQPVSMWLLPPTEGEGAPRQSFWQLAEDSSP